MQQRRETMTRRKEEEGGKNCEMEKKQKIKNMRNFPCNVDILVMRALLTSGAFPQEYIYISIHLSSCHRDESLLATLFSSSTVWNHPFVGSILVWWFALFSSQYDEVRVDWAGWPCGRHHGQCSGKLCSKKAVPVFPSFLGTKLLSVCLSVYPSE